MMLRALQRGFSTVNKGQMKQFDGISDWWHPSGPMHILYKYNYERVQFLRQNLIIQQQNDALKPLNGVSILDVGCGAGFMAKSLARLGANVVGLDPNATSYKEAVEHKAKFGEQLSGLTYFNCTLEEYFGKNEQKKEFDVVASMDVVEHVDNPQSFLGELARAVRPGGTVMVSTIARNPLTWLTHIVMAEYVTGIVPKHTHHYDKFINPNDLQEMLLSEGVQVLARRELDINWRGQFERKTGGGNYIMIGRKAAKNE